MGTFPLSSRQSIMVVEWSVGEMVFVTLFWYRDLGERDGSQMEELACWFPT